MPVCPCRASGFQVIAATVTLCRPLSPSGCRLPRPEPLALRVWVRRPGAGLDRGRADHAQAAGQVPALAFSELVIGVRRAPAGAAVRRSATVPDWTPSHVLVTQRARGENYPAGTRGDIQAVTVLKLDSFNTPAGEISPVGPEMNVMPLMVCVSDAKRWDFRTFGVHSCSKTTYLTSKTFLAGVPIDRAVTLLQCALMYQLRNSYSKLESPMHWACHETIIMSTPASSWTDADLVQSTTRGVQNSRNNCEAMPFMNCSGAKFEDLDLDGMIESVNSSDCNCNFRPELSLIRSVCPERKIPARCMSTFE